MSQQGIGRATDGGGAEEQVHHAEERPLEQQWQAAGQHARAVLRVQRFQFARQTFGLLGVPLPEGLDLRRDPGLRELAAHRVVAERQDEQPYGDGEYETAAATARPPAMGVRTADIAVTTWYAASTGTPKRLIMTGNPPAGQSRQLTAGDGHDDVVPGGAR